MRITFAPMEGITVYCYRNVHHELFGVGIDRYYTPFLSIYKNNSIKKRDIREILPDNNRGLEGKIIPQIMANDADEIIWALKELNSRGYDEINLNMGCPVATVVNKHKGSGMLKDPERLSELFERVFSDGITEKVRFTVKTRLGLSKAEEFENILPVLNKFPFTAVIVHPRVRTQMYSGEPDMEMFSRIYENSKNPVGYNGNIFTPEDYKKIVMGYPNLYEVMLGRGIVSNPALARQIVGGDKMNMSELKSFVDALTDSYRQEIPGDDQLMHKMKETWVYVGKSLKTKSGEAADDLVHKILVSRNIADYRNAVRNIFKECEIAN